jgi:hypothetical protein
MSNDLNAFAWLQWDFSLVIMRQILYDSSKTTLRGIFCNLLSLSYYEIFHLHLHWRRGTRRIMLS